MNAKTAKAIRRAIRESIPAGTAPTGHTVTEGRSVMAPDLEAGLNLDGTPRFRLLIAGGTVRNAAGTARLAYRNVKKLPASYLRSVF